jgi:hypothetical protein
MRKFFRSKNSTVQPVGQGHQYEFSAGDYAKIEEEFLAWRARAALHPAAKRAGIAPPSRKKPEPPKPTSIYSGPIKVEDLSI